MKLLKKKHLKVDSDLKALEQVLRQFNQINQPWVPKQDWLQCRLALAEGFTNAIRHAHKELSSSIPVEIDLCLNQHSLEIRIWDYGPPFDLNAYLENACTQENVWSGGGRGLKILQKIADRLSYIRTDDDRNCLIIIKQFSQQVI